MVVSRAQLASGGTFCAALGALVGGVIASLARGSPILDVIENIRGWQTLIAAVVAAVAVSVTWLNVNRQARVTIMAREEDRIERIMPGLIDAQRFLTSAVVTIRSDRRAKDALVELGITDAKTDNIDDAVAERLPRTDDFTHQRIAQTFRYLLFRDEIRQKAIDARLKADRRGKTVSSSEAVSEEVGDKFYKEAVDAVAVLFGDLHKEISEYRKRLPVARAAISRFFKT